MQKEELHAGMAKTAFAAFRVVECFHGFPLGRFVARHHQLGYAVAIGNGERFGREVGHDNAYFTPIVSIDGTGSVEQGDAMFESQSGARPHLCLIAGGQGNTQARWHQAAAHGRQGDGRIEIGAQVYSCTERSGIPGQGMLGVIDYADFHVVLRIGYY